MTDNEHGIAGEAHGLVYGARAKTYGHPRFDFRIIAKVWSGLLQDLLKDGAELDEYRVAVLMSGLKLCRLVKSPQHKDSRVDTIGYMLTMERLDEPIEEELSRADAACAADDDLDDALPLTTITALGTAPRLESMQPCEVPWHPKRGFPQLECERYVRRTERGGGAGQWYLTVMQEHTLQNEAKEDHKRQADDANYSHPRVD